MKFTIMGYTVENAEQARSILLIAKLHDNQPVVDQCIAVIQQYEK